MKLRFTLNQIAFVVCLVASFLIAGLILTEYPGLLDLQVGADGFHIVIDGRLQPQRLGSALKFHDSLKTHSEVKKTFIRS
jgi:hypothetical protein